MYSDRYLVLPKNRIKYMVFSLGENQGQPSVSLEDQHSQKKLIVLNQKILENELIKRRGKLFLMIQPQTETIECVEGVIPPTQEILKRFIFQICMGKIFRNI